MEIDRSYGAVVFTEDDTGKNRRYLLVHHSSGHHWDHPKGHPDPGETPQDTAIREIAEEAGVIVNLEESFFQESSWLLPDGRTKITGYFLGRLTGSLQVAISLQDGEILNIQWLPYREARQTITYETGRCILDKAEDFLAKTNSSY